MIKLPLMKKTELIKLSVMKPSPLWLTKLETTEMLLPLWNPALPIMKISYNKPKSIWLKLNTTMTKQLNLLKPEPLKEKVNIKLGLMKTTNHQLKLPLWKKELN